MFNTIYVENQLIEHPRVKNILARFSDATLVLCEHYGEVFNRSSQNFRLQKNSPSLMLAEKNNRLVLPAPDGYGIGGKHNYYFSHMMNCVYDCRYCFLQGMYNSANYVLFVNFEDFGEEIRRVATAKEGPVYFFSGYDCDSLALEPVSQFGQYFIDVFRDLPNGILELRTKSTQVRHLLSQSPLENIVVAFSLSPENIDRALEHKAPNLEKRLDAMQKLAQQGWKIGLRFDPLIYHDSYQTSYEELFVETFSRLALSSIHSVSLGSFRLPQAYFKKLVRLYPDEKLFASPLSVKHGMMGYHEELEQEMMSFCYAALKEHISEELIFCCDYS